MTWAKVEEILPEYGQLVLVVVQTPGGLRRIEQATLCPSRYDSGHNVWRDGWDRLAEDCHGWNDKSKWTRVTHWMPLPELP